MNTYNYRLSSELGAVAFCPLYDSTHAEDAIAFRAGAVHWQRVMLGEAVRKSASRVSIMRYDNRQPDAARRVKSFTFDLARQAQLGRVDHFAYFGHGLPHRASSLGLTGPQMARAMLDASLFAPGVYVRIGLYACSMGRDTGPRGAAWALANELASAGLSGCVDAHTTPGHMSRNPDVRRFDFAKVAGKSTVRHVDWYAGSVERNRLRDALNASEEFRYASCGLTVSEIRARIKGE